MMCTKCGREVGDLAAHYRMHHHHHVMVPTVVGAERRAAIGEVKKLKSLTKRWSGKPAEVGRLKRSSHTKVPSPLPPVKTIEARAGISLGMKKRKM